MHDKGLIWPLKKVKHHVKSNNSTKQSDIYNHFLPIFFFTFDAEMKHIFIFHCLLNKNAILVIVFHF